MTDNPLIVEIQKRDEQINGLRDKVTRARMLFMFARDLLDNPDTPPNIREKARRALGLRRAKRGRRG